MLFRFLLVWCILLNTALLLAQEDGYRHYTVEDGLPSNEVYHILQDKNGYLWFSTDRGVSRYDGNEFKNFTTADGLPDNTVFFCHQDESGRIWFLSYSASLSYYENGKIKPYEFNRVIELQEWNKSIKVSFLNKGNEVYVGTYGAGYYHIDEHGNLDCYNDSNGIFFQKTPIGYLGYSTEANLRGNHQLIYLDGNKKKIYFYPRIDQAMLRVFQKDGEVLLLDGTNLFRCAGDSIQFIRSFQTTLVCVDKDRQGTYWFGLIKKGAYAQPQLTTPEKDAQRYFPLASVSWIIQDFEDGRWFSTNNNGVYYQPNGIFIKSFDRQKLPMERVTDMCKGSDGKMYFSYNNGQIWSVNEKEEVQFEGSVPLKLLQPSVNPIFYDTSSGKLLNSEIILNWIWRDSLVFFDLIKKYKIRKTSMVRFPSYSTKKIVSDGQGGIWTYISSGMFHFTNSHLDDIVFVVNIANEFDQVERMVVRPDAVYTDRSRFLVAARDGVYELQRDHYIEYMGNQYPLLRNRVDDIKKGNGDTFFLASRGMGLITWTKDTTFSINTTDGLSDNMVNSIALDENGSLWVATNHGLNHIRFRKKHRPYIRQLSVSQGLPSNYILKVVVDGNDVWVGTTRGIGVFDKRSVEPNTISPIIRLDSINVTGLETSLISGSTLTYGQNQVTFYYTGISFKNVEPPVYHYQLQGWDASWQQTSGKSVRYNALAPGEYTFLVKVSNEDGYWSAPVSCSFEILPPLWKRWWFILIAIAAIAALVFFIVWRREKRIMKIAEIQRYTIEIELKALRSQMNPHFTFNTLNSIQKYILKHDALQANDYLGEFASLIRRVLENSRHPRISLQNELDTLKLYLKLEKLRFGEKLTYTFQVDPVLDLEEIEVPPTLIQPYVENAIMHGISHLASGGRINIEIRQQDERVRCTITDNGIGRERSGSINMRNLKNTRSLGSEITNDRIALMNLALKQNFEVYIEDMKDADLQPSGTRVDIFIPIETVNFQNE